MRRASACPPTRPSLTLITRQAPISTARPGLGPLVVNRFVQAQRGRNLRLQARMEINVVPLERLLHHQQLKIVELLQVVNIQDSEYAEFASTLSLIFGKRRRTSRITAMSLPGLIFSFDARADSFGCDLALPTMVRIRSISGLDPQRDPCRGFQGAFRR